MPYSSVKLNKESDRELSAMKFEIEQKFRIKAFKMDIIAWSIQEAKKIPEWQKRFVEWNKRQGQP